MWVFEPWGEYHVKLTQGFWTKTCESHPPQFFGGLFWIDVSFLDFFCWRFVCIWLLEALSFTDFRGSDQRVFPVGMELSQRDKIHWKMAGLISLVLKKGLFSRRKGDISLLRNQHMTITLLRVKRWMGFHCAIRKRFDPDILYYLHQVIIVECYHFRPASIQSCRGFSAIKNSIRTCHRCYKQGIVLKYPPGVPHISPSLDATLSRWFSKISNGGIWVIP